MIKRLLVDQLTICSASVTDLRRVDVQKLNVLAIVPFGFGMLTIRRLDHSTRLRSRRTALNQEVNVNKNIYFKFTSPTCH